MAAEEVRRMRRVPLSLTLALALALCAPAAATETDTRTVRALGQHRSLPADPLAVIALSSDDLARRLDEAAGLLSLLGEATADGAAGGSLERLEWEEGFSLAEVLAAIGPEVALSIDLPPIDIAVAAVQYAPAEAPGVLLSRSGLVAGIRDPARLARALGGVRLGSEPHAVRFSWKREGGVSGMTLFVAVRGSAMFVGFSRAWILERLAEEPAPSSLTEGADFQRVFAHLDREPTSLTYVNLPRLRELIDGSTAVAAALRTDGQVRRLLGPLLDPETMALGVGSTSTSVGGGARTTSFGPAWMTGPAVSGGLLAALAVPSLLAAVDGDRERDTLADIRTIALACEGFSSHARRYPGPTDGWVAVDDLAVFLEPIYIAALPRTDAWDRPLLYWSDGTRYRILSTGGDGRMDRDWSSVSEPVRSARHGDIVFGDGRVLVVPE
jgi:hypothetical protein